MCYFPVSECTQLVSGGPKFNQSNKTSIRNFNQIKLILAIDYRDSKSQLKNRIFEVKSCSLMLLNSDYALPPRQVQPLHHYVLIS